MDGDRIRVPLLGVTVAVTGLVRQPAIYELPAGQKGISAADLMALAGGEEVRGAYRLSLLRIEADGRTNLVPIPDASTSVRDSEILFVQFSADQTVSRVTLSGGIGLAGNYPITSGSKLSELLKAPGALGTEPYTLFGIVSRRDPATLLRTLSAFTPVAVLRGTEDMTLQNDDIVRVISIDETRLLIRTLHDYKMQLDVEREAVRNPIQAATSATSPVGNSALAGSILATANANQDVATIDRNNIQDLANRPLPG